MPEPREARAAGYAPDPTERFSDRMDAYVRHRPTYPPAGVDFLRSAGLLRAGLAAGHVVYGVEPNAAMWAAAERQLARRGLPPVFSPAGSLCGIVAGSCRAHLHVSVEGHRLVRLDIRGTEP